MKIKVNNKEAEIKYTINNGYISNITQTINNGLEIEKIFIISKFGFSTYADALKWSLKHLKNKLL